MNSQSNSNWMLNFTFKDLTEAMEEKAKHSRQLTDEGIEHDSVISIMYRDVKVNPTVDWIKVTIFKR